MTCPVFIILVAIVRPFTKMSARFFFYLNKRNMTFDKKLDSACYHTEPFVFE